MLSKFMQIINKSVHKEYFLGEPLFSQGVIRRLIKYSIFADCFSKNEFK